MCSESHSKFTLNLYFNKETTVYKHITHAASRLLIRLNNGEEDEQKISCCRYSY